MSSQPRVAPGGREAAQPLRRKSTRVIPRRARASDAPEIYALIAHYASTGLLLPRAEEEIRTNVDHFLVFTSRGKLVGCVALEPYGAELAEIRSLAVTESARGLGLGSRLLRFALAEARRRGFVRVFAVTHNPEIFAVQGFLPTKRQAIPEKIARDCTGCTKEPSCRLVAVVATVNSNRAMLPVLQDSAAALP